MKIIKIQEKVQIKEFILFFAMSCFCTFTVQSTYMSFGSGPGFVSLHTISTEKSQKCLLDIRKTCFPKSYVHGVL